MQTDDNGFENEYNNDFNIDVDENFYGYDDSNNDNTDSNLNNNSGKSKKVIIIVIVAIILIACIGGLIFFLVRNNGNGGNTGGGQPALKPSVTLSETSFELKVGSSKKITYTVENYSGDVPVTWSSSNKSIATVSNDGTVKGVKAGTVNIKVTYVIEGVSYEKTCFVTVSKSGSEGTTPTVTLSKTSLELTVGASEKITYTVKNGTITVTWSSSDKSIATVDSNGTVKGLKEGSATITATYTVNGKKQQKTCKVIVKKSGGTTTPVKDTTDPTLSYTITSGKENTWVNTDVSIKVTASDNSGSVTVKYTTNCNSNCKYTTVSDGIIKVSTAGSSVITIVAEDKAGNSTSKKVTVMIDKTKPTCSLKVSETGTLSATYSDTGSSNISYYGFSSSYSGTSGNTQTLSKAGTYTYYVKDKAGNTNTCSLAVNTKTQYRYQDCISCKSCSEAGTDYGWELRSSGCAELHSNPGYYEGGGYYKRECYSDDKQCPGTPNMCYTYIRYTIGNKTSCEKCGCNKWGEFSAWTNTKYTESNSRNVETKNIYYSE